MVQTRQMIQYHLSGLHSINILTVQHTLHMKEEQKIELEKKQEELRQELKELEVGTHHHHHHHYIHIHIHEMVNDGCQC